MSVRQRVAIAEVRLARAPEELVAYGLGSCLGIALYDPEGSRGALAHSLLPEPRSGAEVARSGKFVSTALDWMVEELGRAGVERRSLVAKIAGGANMFEFSRGEDREPIGTRNVRAARQALESLGIPLVGEDTGGRHGRTVVFDLASGEVLVQTLRGPQQVISL